MPDNERIQSTLRERFKLATREAKTTRALYRIAEIQLREKVSRSELNSPVIFSEDDIPPPCFEHISLEELLKKRLTLSSVAEPMRSLKELSKGAAPDRRKVCTAIGMDPKMTAAILRLANTPRYASPGTVRTVSGAVNLIGVKPSILLALGAHQSIRPDAVLAQRFSVYKFWQHSLACAFICRKIAMRAAPGNEESFYVTGLLHDLGQLVITGAIPESQDELLRYVSLRGLPIAEAERTVLGFDHARVGNALFKAWGFPHEMILAIGEHHSLPASLSPLGTAMSVADNMSKAFGLGTHLNYYVRDIPSRYLHKCKIPESDWPQFVFETYRETNRFLRQVAKRFALK
ncbi:MAG TPA: HDOD domain-containing protein [Desulfomicrobiaceae bacterium]|nr:HDOD domain-containing protein [Desulfomicrobiaceae bacterium]